MIKTDSVPADDAQAGHSEPLPNGALTFLSPKPLPTGFAPIDHAHAVGDVQDHFLELGSGVPSAFSWHLTLGVPFWCFVFIAFLAPLGVATFGLLYGAEKARVAEVFWELSTHAWWFGVAGGGVALLVGYLPHWQIQREQGRTIPVRFNRQRREVCFVPKSQVDPIFVPWEELVAWVIEAKGVTEFGVQRQYGVGFGFYRPETGKKYTVEYQTSGLAQAISNWEAIRAYMEYEVHTLKEIQDPLELQGPDDPPWEGVHVFRNARKRLHEQYRSGEASWLYVFGWYLYHVMTFWTIPNRLVEWEARKIKSLTGRAVPESMVEWSKPIPEAQWAKPSEELKRLSEKVRAKLKAQPSRLPQEIFAEVYAEENREAMPA